MGCGASSGKVADTSKDVEAPLAQVDSKVDSEATTATPPEVEDPEKQKKEEEAAALKIQSKHRGQQARKEVAAMKAEKPGAAPTPDETTIDGAAANKEEADLTNDEAAKLKAEEEEAAKQKAEEEAAALKIQSKHRGQQARKEVASMKAEKEGSPADAEAEKEGSPAEASNDADAEAAKQKAEEEAAALKIQSKHRGQQARKEVASMKAEKEGSPAQQSNGADAEATGEDAKAEEAPAGDA